VQHLAAANGAGGARAEGDQGANSAGAGVGGVDDAEGAEHALSLARVLGDGLPEVQEDLVGPPKSAP
jgi:hypothetical protein